MPDERTQPTPPPTPVQRTAAVPLKKETVRITLRARPGAGLTQPKEMTAPVPPPSITSPVPRPITTSVTPAGASNTTRVPTAPAPMSPVPLAKTGSIAPASKATAPIQLPSAPLPPPAARPATQPVQLPPGAPPSARTTTYVKLDTVPVPTAPAAPAPPSPPRPVAPSGVGAPKPPGAPSAPRPGGAMAPTVPLAKAPAPPKPGAPSAPRPGGGAPMAPTVPLAKAPGAPRPGVAAPGAKVEAGASTVPLAKAPAAPKVPGTGTAPMVKTGGPTQNLPKATVQLAKGTQPMGKGAVAAPAAAARSAAQDSAMLYEEKDPEAGLAPLAVVCTVLAIGLCLLNMFGSDAPKMWAEPGESSAFLPPLPKIPAWEQSDGAGGYTSSYTSELRKISSKYE